MKGKTLYLPAAIMLALGILFVLPSPSTRMLKGLVRDAMAPYHSLTAAFGAGVRQRIDRRRHRHTLADQVAEQQAELQTLRRKTLELSGVREENAALRRQLNYVSRSPADLVACRVIARGDITGWWRTLRLNRGSVDGIRPAMPVVSERGLVGRIEQTSRRTADVLLISDASSSVSVRVMPSGTPGILEGAPTHLGRRELPHLLLPVSTFGVDFLSLQDDVREGNDVVTSGLGGIFPAGIPVGTVIGVRTDSSGLYRRADIMPTADFSRLDTLYVIRHMHEGTLP